MAWIFRKSKTFGPFRLTATKRGFALSAGVRGARVSLNSRGEVRESVGLPGTGLYARNKVGQLGRHEASAQTQTPGVLTEINGIVDATGGTRALLDGQVGVAELAVVGVHPSVAELAQMSGVGKTATGPWIRGIRDGLLQPEADGYSVLLMITRQDNPALFGRRDGDTPKATVIGRLAKRDLTKWQDQLAGRPIKVVVYLDATPGYTARAEVRLRPDLLRDSPSGTAEVTPSPDTTPAAPEATPVALPPAGWFTDPTNPSLVRWWDGTAWSTSTSPAASGDATAT